MDDAAAASCPSCQRTRCLGAKYRTIGNGKLAAREGREFPPTQSQAADLAPLEHNLQEQRRSPAPPRKHSTTLRVTESKRFWHVREGCN